MKRYIVFAGVNGAGKSTLYQTVAGLAEMPRINLDEIVRSFGSWKNQKDILKAGKIAVRMIDDYFKGNMSFNQETTLCGKSIYKNLLRARENGYRIELYYVGLDSVEIAKQRIRKRVSDGGHGIADEDVERRYTESLIQLEKALKVCDYSEIYDNSEIFTKVAEFESGKCVWHSKKVPDWVPQRIFEQKIKLVCLPCLCVDVFDGTNEIRPGGEALNFSVHAAEFEEFDVKLLGIIGDDEYGKVVLDSIADKNIDKRYIRIDNSNPTANNRTYLTTEGDRYYKEDSWNGNILEQIVLNDEEIKVISEADIVFIHFWASCFKQVLELKKKYGFKLAVDFDVYRNFDDMKCYAPDIDFFMISGEEKLQSHFEAFSKEYDGLFNMTFGESGSVTYHKGYKHYVSAKQIHEVVDTTGCGDSYHAGFVCSYLIEHDIEKAMLTGSEIAAETLGKYGGF